MLRSRQNSTPAAARMMAPPTPTQTPIIVFLTCGVMPVSESGWDGTVVGVVTEVLEDEVTKVWPAASVVVTTVTNVEVTGDTVVAADSVVSLLPSPPVDVEVGAEVGEPPDVVVGGVVVGPLVLVGVASVDVGDVLSVVVVAEVGVEEGSSLVLVGVSEVDVSTAVVDDEVGSSALDEVGSAAADSDAISVPIEMVSCLLTSWAP